MIGIPLSDEEFGNSAAWNGIMVQHYPVGVCVQLGSDLGQQNWPYWWLFLTLF